MFASGKKIILPDSVDFIDRGDPASADFTQATLIEDNDWHDLDLSGIVGAAAKLVLIRFQIQVDDTGLGAFIREKGNANTVNAGKLYSQAVNVYHAGECLVMTDATGKCEYLFANGTWNMITITVGGWYE